MKLSHAGLSYLLMLLRLSLIFIKYWRKLPREFKWITEKIEIFIVENCLRWKLITETFLIQETCWSLLIFCLLNETFTKSITKPTICSVTSFDKSITRPQSWATCANERHATVNHKFTKKFKNYSGGNIFSTIYHDNTE